MTEQTSALALMVNAMAARRLSDMFPGYFQGAKHDHYADFGYPTDPEFKDFHRIYERNGFAAAAVDKTVAKTWQDFPLLQERQRDGSERGKGKETRRERLIRQRFDDLRLWQHFAEADRRSMVGRYGALVLRFADSKRFDEPLDAVPGGLDGLVEVIPAWESQLTVQEWDTDQQSPTYGQPKMFQFNEAAVQGSSAQPRQLAVHPDRVLIFSRDGTVHGRSALKPGFNDLVTLEKVNGAGGEGFWKNAKLAPILEADPAAKIEAMAKTMGVKPDEVADAMNEQVEAYNKGFDKTMLLQGITAKSLEVKLPSPEHFLLGPLQSFAGSMGIPLKILVGNQTGERASTEDVKDWAQFNMSRRTGLARPTIMAFVNLLERVGILPDRDWHLDWADLTEASVGEKFDRIVKMADANQKNKGEVVFTGDDMRGAVGMEPLSPEQKKPPQVEQTDPNQPDPGVKPQDGSQ